MHLVGIVWLILLCWKMHFLCIAFSSFLPLECDFIQLSLVVIHIVHISECLYCAFLSASTNVPLLQALSTHPSKKGSHRPHDQEREGEKFSQLCCQTRKPDSALQASQAHGRNYCRLFIVLLLLRRRQFRGFFSFFPYIDASLTQPTEAETDS